MKKHNDSAKKSERTPVQKPSDSRAPKLSWKGQFIDGMRRSPPEHS
jgi:hypothetical protein